MNARPVATALLLCAPCVQSVLSAQDATRWHGKQPKSAVIKNVHVVRGDGTPAYGPTSVYIEAGRIVAGRLTNPEAEIDGKGCYLLPGFVNTHGHLQASAAGIPISKEYILNLWLAAGITTVRDNGSLFARTVRMRAASERGEVAAPRIIVYRGFGRVTTAEQARAKVKNSSDRDENIAALEELKATAAGSKYEGAIDKLLVKQMKYKDAGK